MKTVISPRGEKEFKKLQKIHQIAVAKKIRSIGESPSSEGEEKLKGFHNIFRVRVGDYRIVYRKTAEEIYVVLISHRKDIYRLIHQLFR